MAALEQMRTSNLSIRNIAKLYAVPESTLRDKIHGRTDLDAKSGPSTVLSTEEDDLANCAAHMSLIGYGTTKNELLDSVKRALDKAGRASPFKDNLPGRDWFDSFLRRHPNLSLTNAEALSKERAVCSSPADVQKWYVQFQKEVHSHEGGQAALADPRRIWNAAKVGLACAPKAVK